MNKAQPIKDLGDLEHFKNYYLNVKPNIRNYALMTLGLNTALRISDILSLHWENVYDFSKNKISTHIGIVEQKTGKSSVIYINRSIQRVLARYKENLERKEKICPGQYLFLSQKKHPLSRYQAWRIIKKAAEDCCISGTICPHSMRKTFGYQAWKQGVSPAMLMDVFNHSSYDVTRRYLGIEQDDRDEVFRNVCL